MPLGQFPFKKIFFKEFIFRKYIHTITMHIKFWQQCCNVYNTLKTLHPGNIRTRDLLFCSRTRWPQCHAVSFCSQSTAELPDGAFSKIPIWVNFGVSGAERCW
jgi:hypothetical protein